MTEQDKINEQKSSLIDDLLSVNTVMDELWQYHPDNPKKKDIKSEYQKLLQIKEEVEQELEKFH